MSYALLRGLMALLILSILEGKISTVVVRASRHTGHKQSWEMGGAVTYSLSIHSMEAAGNPIIRRQLFHP